MKKHGKAITISFFVGMFLAGMSLIAYAAELQQQPKLQQQQPTLQQQPKLEKTQLIPLGPPDLFVESINKQIVNQSVSGPAWFTYKPIITIKNGGGAAGPFDVRVEKRKEQCPADSPDPARCSNFPWELVTAYNIPGLPGRGTTTNTLPNEFTDSYLPAEGNTPAAWINWNLKVTVDSGHAVTESNEGNNEYRMKWNPY
jgi:hypothetical protein